MHPLSPADELAEIRCEIARLKTREAAVRNLILQGGTSLLTGRWHRVEIEHRLCALLDKTLLPAAIRTDPQYLRERELHILRSLPLGITPQPRPGWPIRRETAARPLH